MTAIKRKTFVWLVALTVLVAVAGGLWFAHAHGWLSRGSAWVQQRLEGKKASPGDGGMNMPGMDMGSMGHSGRDSKVPGHSEVNLPWEVRQRIGVTVAKVEQGRLRMSIRTVGIVGPDETRLAKVHLKTEGWVQKVFVNYVGQQVKKGAPLLSIYSPQFLTAQQQYLDARKSDQAGVARLIRRRLELWDVPAKEIEAMDKSGTAPLDLTLRSPIGGTVLDRKAFNGQYITPKTELYTVADLSTVWVQAQVYEYELPHVELDQPATVTVPALPGQQFTGKIVFLQPIVEEKTRTVQVRVELPNKEGQIRPGMFANVEIGHDMGEGLLVPAAAVLRTGERDIAYREESAGRFVPVAVEIGSLRFGGRFHVLKGLKAGEKVATSADFLIDSESRLRMGGMAGMDMGGKKKGHDDKGGGMKHAH